MSNVAKHLSCGVVRNTNVGISDKIIRLNAFAKLTLMPLTVNLSSLFSSSNLEITGSTESGIVSKLPYHISIGKKKMFQPQGLVSFNIFVCFCKECNWKISFKN